VVSEPELELAVPLQAEPLPAAPVYQENQIPLPFEGEGRRMSIPVAIEHGGVQRETWMMLDTGATYTTLSEDVLRELGSLPDENSPTIRLHTANGDRDARVILLDRVWLGDLFLDGVAVATCESCSSPDTSGLLGLNVTGVFNMGIDVDRREVLFTSRAERNRRLDIKPFTEVKAHVTRFPGGRVEVDVALVNNSPRDVTKASVSVMCGEEAWQVRFGEIRSHSIQEVRRRLPPHEPCDPYQVSLESAYW
jgi:hypothetical protein